MKFYVGNLLFSALISFLLIENGSGFSQGDPRKALTDRKLGLLLQNVLKNILFFNFNNPRNLNCLGQDDLRQIVSSLTDAAHCLKQFYNNHPLQRSNEFSNSCVYKGVTMVKTLLEEKLRRGPSCIESYRKEFDFTVYNHKYMILVEDGVVTHFSVQEVPEDNPQLYTSRRKSKKSKKSKKTKKSRGKKSKNDDDDK